MRLYSTAIYLFVLFFSCSFEQLPEQDDKVSSGEFADVTGVSAAGESGNFVFSVTIASPDLGCEQYADWWEVVSISGDLIYRRILTHSHIDEQPFTRSGGNVDISDNQMVWVRGHMNNNGYGGTAYKGSKSTGFKEEIIPDDFAMNLESSEPQPNECPF